MTTRHAWNDNNFEGKLLRKAIGKLAKKLKNTDDTDEIIKITNAISAASNAKKGLAQYEHLDDKYSKVLEAYDFFKLHQNMPEVIEDAKYLPNRPSD